MNNERILHILDQSTCLTRRQMKDYLGGAMLPEEVHAAELHIASCPLCSMALDGFEQHSDEALEAIASLNSGFLKEHFDAITPKIHLNSMAPAAIGTSRRRKKSGVPLWRLTSVAAALLLGFGALWYLDHRTEKPAERAIAQAEQPAPRPDQRRPDVLTDRAATPVISQAPAAVPAANAPVEPPRQKPLPVTSAPATPEAAPQAAPAEESAGIAAADQAKPDSGDMLKKNKAETSGESRFEVNRNAYAAEAAPVQPEELRTPVTTGNKYKARAKAPTPDEPAGDHLQRGDELFRQNKYGSALSHYNKEISSGDRRRQAQATVMAARCYLQLGNRQRAIALLQRVADNESGSAKRQARRLLRELESR